MKMRSKEKIVKFIAWFTSLNAIMIRCAHNFTHTCRAALQYWHEKYDNEMCGSTLDANSTQVNGAKICNYIFATLAECRLQKAA